MLPGIADVGEDRGQRHDLGLIGQIEDAVDVQHVQEFRGLYEAMLDLRFVPFVAVERQIQQSLPVAGNGRQFFAVLACASAARRRSRV